jgi:glycerol-3-phosphate dehydrogenase
VAEKAVRQICAFNKERLPEKTLQTRPPLIPHLTASGFIRLCEIDPSAAENHVNTLLQNESVVYMEDLMMRRTDWGMSPQDAEGVKAKVREILGWDESDQPVRDSAIQYSNAAQPN